ncbi:MAG TPA: tenascin-X [Myxococcaceae bacterium]
MLGALAPACHEQGTSTALRPIQVEPVSLDFGALYPGLQTTLTFEIRNSGRSEQALRFQPPAAPFFLVNRPDAALSGPTPVSVVFVPTGAGEASGDLTVQGELGGPLVIHLTGTGKPIPPCPVAVTCTEETFDPIAEHCVRHTLPNGSGCDPHNACVTGARCDQGVCRGAPVACDDGDACTIDVCNPLDGCHALPATPCPGDGRCQLGRCDSKLGCVLEQAPDGTLCELDPTCDAARICITGACVVRDPPDGFVCKKATPCQEEGRCQGSTCVVPPASPLLPTWTFDADAAQPQPLELHDFTLESDGRMTLSGWFEVPILRANSSAARSPPGYSRRCILWNDRVVCLDYPWRYDFPDGSVDFHQGTVSMLELDTAATLWRYDLPASRPDFVAQTEGMDTLFLARVAVLASDRFAILFEGYPKGTNNRQNPAPCRNYFLVLLDARGHMVSANKIEDPFLLRCDHPHPYGFSSDADGNLYIHFAPSLPGSAPLVPQAPGMFMSFTREGLQRWRREETWVGGEIAISHGRLFPERGDAVLSGVDGSRVASTPTQGRAVVSADRVVLGPQPFAPGGQLVGLNPDYSPRWTRALSGPDVFLTQEIRLARWQPTGQDIPETVALAFATASGQRELAAYRVADGKPVWSCSVPAAFRGEPNLFELVPGKLGLMSGAETCGQCDPPYAHSHAAFSAFDVPTLSPVESPWPGTFAGPAHDGHEKAVVPPPGPSP